MLASLVLCTLACCFCSVDGYRLASSTSKEGETETEAEAAALTAPARSLAIEPETKSKLQELASVREAIRHGLNPYGSKAWRAAHGVILGVECKGSGVHMAEGGATIASVFKKSPKMCSAFCEETEGCVAWSWNKDDVNKNCNAHRSCLRREPKSSMVSGLKASLDGMWSYRSTSDLNDFDIEGSNWFVIAVERNGEISWGEERLHGMLKMVDGPTDSLEWKMVNGRVRGEDAELDAEVKDAQWEQAGKVFLRPADGKLLVQCQLDYEEHVTYFIAEKKEALFQPYDRVAVKQDKVIAASDVRLWGNLVGNHAFVLRRGEGGTVDNVDHPRKTGVVFDQDPDKIVWVDDALVVKSVVFRKVSEEEVRSVSGALGDVLMQTIQDPITLEIFQDPVIASDGYTYERRAMEELMARAEDHIHTVKSPMTNERLSSVKLSPNYAIRSLVSSVIEKIDAAHVAAANIQKRVRGRHLRKAGCSRPCECASWRLSDFLNGSQAMETEQ